MNAEILSIGTELLLGQIIDTNAAYLAEKLAGLGINLYFKTTVGDNSERINQALGQALNRADLIITTGGLGPTTDDLTIETIAQYFGEVLVVDHPSLKKIEGFFEKRNAKMSNNKKQALRPKNAMIIPNPLGSAPGMILEKGDKVIISLPGVPKEMYKMMEKTVIPFLLNKLGNEKSIIKSRTLKLVGLGESGVEERVIDLILNQSNPTIAPYAKESEVHLRITAKGESQQEIDSMIDQAEEKIRARLDEHIYGVDEEKLEELVARNLAEKSVSIAVAESCTGGLITHRLTNIPGISDYLERGIVSYSNMAKMEVLGVKSEILQEHGAVSYQTALAMAEGVRRISKTDLGLAVTGIAGPTGGNVSKPVGLVYVALFTKEGGRCEKYNFFGDREAIKNRTAQMALNMVKKYLEGLAIC